jgi:hypothetical protein
MVSMNSAWTSDLSFNRRKTTTTTTNNKKTTSQLVLSKQSLTSSSSRMKQPSKKKDDDNDEGNGSNNTNDNDWSSGSCWRLAVQSLICDCLQEEEEEEEGVNHDQDNLLMKKVRGAHGSLQELLDLLKEFKLNARKQIALPNIRHQYKVDEYGVSSSSKKEQEQYCMPCFQAFNSKNSRTSNSYFSDCVRSSTITSTSKSYKVSSTSSSSSSSSHVKVEVENKTSDKKRRKVGNHQDNEENHATIVSDEVGSMHVQGGEVCHHQRIIVSRTKKANKIFECSPWCCGGGGCPNKLVTFGIQTPLDVRKR